MKEQFEEFQSELKKIFMKSLEKLAKECECEKDEDDEEDEDEEVECEIMESLFKDQKLVAKWAFGKKITENLSNDQAKRLWIKAHPDLPIPRVTRTSKDLPSMVYTMYFYMDVYPMYLKFKEKDE